MGEFIYRHTTNTRQFSKKRRKLSDIKYIVVHDTGNTSDGADAFAHLKYLEHAERYGSAHYYVDDTRIVQPIGDTKIAWAVGDNQGHGKYLNGVTNSNSISVELCINRDGDYKKAYKNTVELVKNLMKKFNVSADRVVRHYDVSRKSCPNTFRANNWERWKQFQQDIQEPIEWEIDLSKTSTFGDSDPLDEGIDIVVPIDLGDGPSDWAAAAWNWAVRNKITDGTNPRQEATREEVITMIYRLWEMIR